MPLQIDKSINVLFICSEAAPLVKVGGLGDVAGALPVALNNLNQDEDVLHPLDIRLAIPYYPMLRKHNWPIRHLASFEVETNSVPIEAQVFFATLSGVTIYLIDGKPVNISDTIYGKDFVSDAEKFIFFSLACLHLPQVLHWRVDILHANDWHTAIAVKELRKYGKIIPELTDTKSILSLHNLPFMGTGSEKALRKFKVKPITAKELPEWGRRLPLPMGLATADQVVAVSPTYAKEILTPEYGCDLQDYLKTRTNRITGILNGIDTISWNPSTDQAISVNYYHHTLQYKKKNKQALLKEFSLPKKNDVPLLVLISRLDQQKGVDILIDSLRQIRNDTWQAILLGTGNKDLEQACLDLQEEFPEKVRAAIQFDTSLSRRMYAGADILMMPSRYEPCGLSQMIAMRYGSLPVARATGGLVDSISDFATGSSNATGFLFPEATPDSCTQALRRALNTYEEKTFWKRMQLNAMTQDFSWERSAKAYHHLYTKLLYTSD